MELLLASYFKASEGEFARNRQAWYKRLCEKMVTELCTRYGDLFMIWFDGGADDPQGLGPNVEPIVNQYQPDCLFYTMSTGQTCAGEDQKAEP